MRHTPRNIRDTIEADSIEDNGHPLHEGVVGAITALTRKELSTLGESYKNAQVEIITKQARQAEEIILRTFSQILPTLKGVNRAIAVEINMDMKERLKEILPAIQYLYNFRHGEGAGADLNTLFNSNENEPFELLFVIGANKDGKYYLEKLLLRKI